MKFDLHIFLLLPVTDVQFFSRRKRHLVQHNTLVLLKLLTYLLLPNHDIILAIRLERAWTILNKGIVLNGIQPVVFQKLSIYMKYNTVQHKYNLPRLQRHERDCMFYDFTKERRYNRGF
jgi:hypothetical protein